MIRLALLMGAGLGGDVFAGGGAPGAAPEDPRTFCEVYGDLLDRFTVYESETGFLRSFAFTGRYQGQFFHNSQHAGGFANPGGGFDDNDTDWFTRRFRFGFKAAFLDQFSFAADFNLDPTWEEGDTAFGAVGVGDPGCNGRQRGEVGFFQNLYRVELRWKVNDGMSLAIGKFDPDVTMEDGMSSTRLYTIEQSPVTEMLNHESTAGVKIELAGVLGNDVVLGIYNGGTEDDYRTFPGGELDAQVSDLPQTNGDWGFQVKVNRNLWVAREGADPALAVNHLRAGLWWFHVQDSKLSKTAGLDTNYEEFTDIVSFNTEIKGTGWGAYTDFLYGNVDARKDDDTDLWGVVFMPYYDFSDKWQVVYRYMRMWGGYDDEDRLAGRGMGVDLDWELRTGSGLVEGDRLSSHYVGLNHYICGHKLKLQFGLERLGLANPGPGAVSNEAEYWSYQSAVRMFF